MKKAMLILGVILSVVSYAEDKNKEVEDYKATDERISRFNLEEVKVDNKETKEKPVGLKNLELGGGYNKDVRVEERDVYYDVEAVPVVQFKF